MSQSPKILIVDDELNLLRRYAERLARYECFADNPLQISITDNAYYVADQLRKSDERSTPLWDIIIADVYMPRPISRLAPGQPASVEVVERREGSVDVLRARHVDGGDSSPEHGGFLIARTLRELRDGRGHAAANGVKLVVMSSKLWGAARDILDGFLRELASSKDADNWFMYVDKARWMGEDHKEHLLVDGLFDAALRRAIEMRASDWWGDGFYGDLIDDGSASGRPVVSSPRLREAVEEARTYGENKAIWRILIVGETGTGKSLIARAIYRSRMIALGKPPDMSKFFRVNCSQQEHNFFLAQMFGHVKKGYSGAGEAREGAVSNAADGGLFLDEIHHLTADGQAVLLTFLDNRKFTPLGPGAREKSFEGHLVIAATSDEGRLEMELHGRFDRVVRVPSLADRTEDIVPLARLTLEKWAIANGRPAKSLAWNAIEWLKSQDWRLGNVRTLQRVVGDAADLNAFAEISDEHLEVAWDKQMRSLAALYGHAERVNRNRDAGPDERRAASPPPSNHTRASSEAPQPLREMDDLPTPRQLKELCGSNHHSYSRAAAEWFFGGYPHAMTSRKRDNLLRKYRDALIDQRHKFVKSGELDEADCPAPKAGRG